MVIFGEELKQMRTNMDPLTPTTSTLSPAISHIAETAAALAKVPQQRMSKRHEASETGEGAIAEKKKKKKKKQQQQQQKKQQETVRWVLQAPQRLRSMRDANRGDEAAEDWNEVRQLMEKWEGVAGVDEVKNECMQIMAQ